MSGDRARVMHRASIAGVLLDQPAPRRTTTDAGAPAGTSTFLRGLAMGALVGAAIAGSAYRERRRPAADSRTGR